MKHVGSGIPICGACNTAPTKRADGVFRCECADVPWFEPVPVQADAATDALLRQKGFMLTGAGSYYYRLGVTIFVLSGNKWKLEGAEKTCDDLHEYLSSLPDQSL